MIGQLRGQLVGKENSEALVDCGGVCYEVSLTMSAFFSLPELSQPVVVWTHLQVRDDAHLLYGFVDQQEREMFRELIRISGVGPKVAMGMLSSLPLTDLIPAIEQENLAVLVKIPGVGKKTAERLLIELRDRLAKNPVLLGVAQSASNVATSTAATDTHRDEAETALLALGYRPQDASRMVARVEGADQMPVEDIIRAALKRMVSK